MSPVVSRQVKVLRTQYLVLYCLIAVTALLSGNLRGDEPPKPSDSEPRPLFAQVRTIFVAKCLVCHGNDPKDLKGDYDLRSREAAVKGGESGEVAIVAGEPDKSPLYKAITWADDALQMPPKENDRLSPDQVALIRRWIAAGANWDEVASATAGADARSAPATED